MTDDKKDITQPSDIIDISVNELIEIVAISHSQNNNNPEFYKRFTKEIVRLSKLSDVLRQLKFYNITNKTNNK